MKRNIILITGPQNTGKTLLANLLIGSFNNAYSGTLGMCRPNIACTFDFHDVIVLRFKLSHLQGHSLIVFDGLPSDILKYEKILTGIANRELIWIDKKMEPPYQHRFDAQLLLISNHVPKMSDDFKKRLLFFESQEI